LHVLLTIYSRPDCHLCEEMKQSLERLRDELHFRVEAIDVDADPENRARYGKLIPVLVDEHGETICHYHLDEPALRSRLAVR